MQSKIEVTPVLLNDILSQLFVALIRSLDDCPNKT
jgi:hypothetical protein